MRSAPTRTCPFGRYFELRRCNGVRLIGLPLLLGNLKRLTRADFRSLARLAADFRLVSATANGQNFMLHARVCERLEAFLAKGLSRCKNRAGINFEP